MQISLLDAHPMKYKRWISSGFVLSVLISRSQAALLQPNESGQWLWPPLVTIRQMSAECIWRSGRWPCFGTVSPQTAIRQMSAAYTWTFGHRPCLGVVSGNDFYGFERHTSLCNYFSNEQEELSCVFSKKNLQHKHLYVDFIGGHEHRLSLCVVSWIARHTVTPNTFANTTDNLDKPGLLVNVILSVSVFYRHMLVPLADHFPAIISIFAKSNCDHERLWSAMVLFQIYDVLLVIEIHVCLLFF